MCGRFTLKTPAQNWVQELFPNFELLDLPESDLPRFNIAPTQSITTIVGGDSIAVGDRRSPLRCFEMRWGLLPPWAKELSIGNKMLNARSETAAEKPSFRRPLRERRCVIVADGYYEWKRDGDVKRPFWIHPTQGNCFLMGGLWEVNSKIQPNQPIFSTTILTTNANPKLSSIHNRMPVVISKDQVGSWLAGDVQDVEMLSEFMQPAAEEFFDTIEVSRYVNNARNEGPECLTPV